MVAATNCWGFVACSSLRCHSFIDSCSKNSLSCKGNLAGCNCTSKTSPEALYNQAIDLVIIIEAAYSLLTVVAPMLVC